MKKKKNLDEHREKAKEEAVHYHCFLKKKSVRRKVFSTDIEKKQNKQKIVQKPK